MNRFEKNQEIVKGITIADRTDKTIVLSTGKRKKISCTEKAEYIGLDGIKVYAKPAALQVTVITADIVAPSEPPQKTGYWIYSTESNLWKSLTPIKAVWFQLMTALNPDKELLKRSLVYLGSYNPKVIDIKKGDTDNARTWHELYNLAVLLCNKPEGTYSLCKNTSYWSSGTFKHVVISATVTGIKNVN
jgi:hypothetical protein